jgi:hypothetical protein
MRSAAPASPPAPAASSRWSHSLALFAGTAIVYLLTATWDFEQSIDAVAALVPAWQLAREGTLSLEGVDFPRIPWFIEADGRLVSNRFPGAIFLAVPAYALWPGCAAAPCAGPAALTAAVTAAAAVVALHRTLLRLVDGRTAVVAALIFAFATPTWAVSADALWTHGPAQLVLMLGTLALSRQRWWLAGLSLGTAALLRAHLALVPAVVGLLHSWWTHSWRPAVRVALASAVGVALLLLYDWFAYGSWSPTGGYEDAGFDKDGVGLAGFAYNVVGALVSPQRGLISGSPFLLLLLPGLPSAWRAAPTWVRSAAVAGLVYTAAQLALNRFSGGDSFYTYRLTLELVTLASPLLVLCWATWTSRRRGRCAAFVTLLTMSVLLEALGAVFYAPAGLGPWQTHDVLGVAAVVPEWTAVLVGVALVVGASLLRRVDRHFDRQQSRVN